MKMYSRNVPDCGLPVSQICAVLYPGDATENGKILRLKQQFFLCSASMQVYNHSYVSVSLLMSRYHLPFSYVSSIRGSHHRCS